DLTARASAPARRGARAAGRALRLRGRRDDPQPEDSGPARVLGRVRELLHARPGRPAIDRDPVRPAARALPGGGGDPPRRLRSWPPPRARRRLLLRSGRGEPTPVADAGRLPHAVSART